MLVEGYAILASGIIRSEGRGRLFLVLSTTRLVLTASLAVLGVAVAGVVGAAAGIALGGLGFAVFGLIRWWQAASVGDRATRMKLIRYGVPLSTTTIAQWVLASFDRVLLKFEVAPATLGAYSANYRLGSVVLIFLAWPLAFVWTRDVQGMSLDERKDRTRSWTLSFSLAAAATTVVLTAASPLLIPGFFGSEFDAQPEIVALVGAAGWFGGVYFFLATPFLVAHSTIALARVSAIVVVISLLLNAALISRFQTEGAAVATVSSYGVLCLRYSYCSRRWTPASNEGDDPPLRLGRSDGANLDRGTRVSG